MTITKRLGITFVPDRSDQLRVRIKNIPLSADDSIIVKTLKDEGCILVENPSREKLRVDGKLTNCETGDRIVFVRPLKEPLPKVIYENGRFQSDDCSRKSNSYYA